MVFRLRRKMDNFWRKSPPMKEPKTLSKKPCFLQSNSKNVLTSIEDFLKSIVDGEIQTQHLWDT